MRLTETQTLWGNIYTCRYFIDGKRVSKLKFDEVFDSKPNKLSLNTERPNSYTLRNSWIVED